MKKVEGLEYYITKNVGRAIMDYQMIADGDKVAVAVSGGQDSLVLLRILQARLRFVPIKYELLALHVDLGYPRSFSARLVKYFKKHKIQYHILKDKDSKKRMSKDINCSKCSWLRKIKLLRAAVKLGCNKIALGQHKDDIVEIILMNLFLKKEIFAMAPRQLLFKGRSAIIRPLAYVEESMINNLVQVEKIPHYTCSCAHASPSSRVQLNKLISALEKNCPEIKTNIFRSVQRIKHDYLL